jgi:hypothetical protein
MYIDKPRSSALKPIVASSVARDDAEAALVQTEVETAAPLPHTGATQQAIAEDSFANWEVVRSIWRDVRDRLELAIEQIGRARVRAKYSRIPRYRYRDVINALESDDAVRPSVADKLRRMDNLFQTLKFRPATVKDFDVAEFRQGLEFVHRWLPRLPDGEGPLPSPVIAGTPSPAVDSAA